MWLALGCCAVRCVFRRGPEHAFALAVTGSLAGHANFSDRAHRFGTVNKGFETVPLRNRPEAGESTVSTTIASEDAVTGVPGADRSTIAALARRARTLSWLSLGYMAVEGGVAIFAGVVAGSIALVGFGLDSMIEGFASVVIIWRFTGQRVHSQAAERRAQQLVAIQFFLLAPYVAYESASGLIAGERPDVSPVGIALAVSSMIVMPWLGVAKQRLAEQLGSPATKGEGRQNMLCAYLAGALLVGLLGNALLGAWWLDPVVGLMISAVAVQEGVEAWRGEGCACAGPDPIAILAAGGDDSAPVAACCDDCDG